jgi:hypothetical protein
MKILPLKIKAMPFKEQVPVRSKIIAYNTILEQVNMIAYLGCKILYKGENNII